ncbi:MAG: low affinity iron permease family protein [Alphaproteobacteria bacterium]|nr:low affinity iron permease family protein [Alphaproteobacteria bacterium]
MKIMKIFSNFARKCALLAGHPVTFISSVCIIIAWVLLGPIFNYSDTWQLVINTSTSILTFLMIFLVQNTQNRDNEAVQIKLDELIRSHEGAHNALLDLEELTQKELETIKEKYEKLAKEARKNLRKGIDDTKTTKV